MKLCPRFRSASILLFVVTSALSGAVPASGIDGNQLRSHLRSQYPNLTPAQFEAKLTTASTPQGFFGAFAPYFYEVLQQNAKWRTLSARETSGWCAGDAHIGNFGSMLQESGEAIFTINDVDDGSRCPLLADWIRLAVSARLAKVDVDESKLMTAYRQGLLGAQREQSATVRAMLDDARRKGRQAKKKDVNADGSRLERSDETFELQDAQARDIKSVLARTYGATLDPRDVIDVVGSRHDGGGSAGQQRFRALMRIKGGNQVIELKEEERPATFPLEAAQPAFSERLARTLRAEQSKPPKLVRATRIGERDFLARPRWRGNDGVDEDLCLKHPHVVLDEAYALGWIHRSSAPATYERSLAASDIGAIQELIDELAAAIRKANQEAHQNGR